MKRILLIACFILTFAETLFSQNPLAKQWDKRFGGTDHEKLYSFQQTADGGYILGGWSLSDISGDKTQNNWDTICNPFCTYDYWVLKIDSLGNKQWDKDFGGTDTEWLFSTLQTNDDGYILGGTSLSGISGNKTQDTWGNYDYWIVKTDSLGNKQWDKDFGGTDGDMFNSMQLTSDGGYILGGYSGSVVSGDKTQPLVGGLDFWIIRIDSLGNKLWDKDFGGSSDDQLFSIQQTFDGGYILGGNSISGIGGDKTEDTIGGWDYWIIKTDSVGNKQWDKDFGGTKTDLLISLQQTLDGGYILGGYSYSGVGGDKTQDLWGGNNDIDFWIIKIDSLGNKQWDKDFGGTNYEDEFGNIFQTTDGGFMIAGTSYSNISGDKTEDNLGSEQIWIIKIDSAGNKEWDKTVFNNAHDEIGYSIETHDGCYVFANYTSSDIGGYKTQPNWDTISTTADYWIIKFCDTTGTSSINQITNSQLPISIYPNPTNAILNLSLNKKENILITNLVGEIVFQKTAEGEIELDVSFLSAGIYFIKVGNEVRKFVKE